MVLFDVIEHIDDTGTFLQSVLYHLKPGGWLFINVPAFDSLSSSFDEVVGHLRRYSKPSLRAALAAHRVAIRDLRYWGFSMFPYLVIRKLISPRGVSVSRVIERGVLPPRPWMSRWILRIMELETAWLKNPLLGTSLLAAAVKLDETVSLESAGGRQ